MRRLLVFLALWLLALPAGAAPVPVHWTASAAPAPAHPGEVVVVTVRAAVDPGWHVYSVTPTPNGPAATEIKTLGGWAALGPTTEDPPTRANDPNFGPVAYHAAAATFARAFRAASDGPAPSSVLLHYQTCNDQICLPPTDVALPVAVSITPGTVRAAYAQAPAPKPGGAPDFWPFLAAAVGAGLLALVTPCVFPLIPITLTNFIKQADGDQARLVRLSGGYALGIVALYAGLGLAVSATLGAAGISRIAANPWVNLALFALFVVFALSFFETITLSLPGNLGALQQTARQRGGLAGLILLGGTFVLSSFTCTAPFVGTLLVTAAGGERLRPLIGLLAFAAAFASPFFVFALFPQWIARIPKGGVWLARVKATLGFVELAAALKFLSNTDQVWRWHLLTRSVLLAAWALLAAGAALYLWGPLRFGVAAETERPGVRPSPARRVFGAAFALLALGCFWGLAGRPLSPWVEAFLPVYAEGAAAPANLLPWLSRYDAALAQAKAEGKPLLIDFTGYTCTNCRLNETRVFPDPAIQQAFSKFVRVQLYTDGGPDGPRNQKLQETKFGDVALPLYGILDPQTETVIAKTEGVQSVDGFRQFLAQAPPTSAAAPLWAAYTPQAVTAAHGQPVLIDFTAKWCINCKEIEKDVFEAPSVRAELGQKFVTLRADLTDWAGPTSTALQKQYGFDALPTVVFLDPTGKEIRPLRITGRLSVAEFQKRMRQAEQVPSVPEIG